MPRQIGCIQQCSEQLAPGIIPRVLSFFSTSDLGRKGASSKDGTHHSVLWQRRFSLPDYFPETTIFS